MCLESVGHFKSDLFDSYVFAFVGLSVSTGFPATWDGEGPTDCGLAAALGCPDIHCRRAPVIGFGWPPWPFGFPFVFGFPLSFGLLLSFCSGRLLLHRLQASSLLWGRCRGCADLPALLAPLWPIVLDLLKFCLALSLGLLIRTRCVKLSGKTSE